MAPHSSSWPLPTYVNSPSRLRGVPCATEEGKRDESTAAVWWTTTHTTPPLKSVLRAYATTTVQPHSSANETRHCVERTLIDRIKEARTRLGRALLRYVTGYSAGPTSTGGPPDLQGHSSLGLNPDGLWTGGINLLRLERRTERPSLGGQHSRYTRRRVGAWRRT